MALLDQYVETRDPRALGRVTRYTQFLRLYLTTTELKAAVETYLLDAKRRVFVLSVLEQATTSRKEPTAFSKPATPSATEAQSAATSEPPTPKAKPSLAAQLETEAYFLLLSLSLLSHQKQWTALLAAAQQVVAHLTSATFVSRRTVDFFAARAVTYLTLANEHTSSGSAEAAFDSMRPTLAAAHRTACLRHDEYGQAVYINLLLRGHVRTRQYDAAAKLLSKAAFPEGASTAQLVRYHYYKGRVQAVQLDYTDAYNSLMQAVRKAPTSALPFRTLATKVAVLVQLLMGEVPERATFTAPEMAGALVPYFDLTKAVRVGDVASFRQTLEANAAAFARDGTLTLARRLEANVIKAGLRKISVAYSRIRLTDVASKLGLGSAEDAEFLCAKAIRDGVLEGELVHADAAGNAELRSVSTVNVYATKEPQEAFHKRITFCLDVHNEAVKGMRYPQNAGKSGLESAEERAAREEAEAELAEAVEKGLEDDDEDMF